MINAKLGTDFSNKGGFQNRLQCASETSSQLVKTALPTAVVAGGVLATGKLAADTFKGKKTVAEKGFKAIGNKVKPYLNKVAEKLSKDVIKTEFADKLKKLSSSKVGGIAIFAGAVTAGMAILQLVQRKTDYKLGQIDQKYTDKAKLQEKLQEKSSDLL